MVLTSKQVQNQFINLYGQKGARLDQDRSVHGMDVYSRTFVLRVLSPAMFYAPEVHLQSLEKIWVDRIIHASHWLEFIRKLTGEWQEFVVIVLCYCLVFRDEELTLLFIQDTVILTANMAFLAIQSVDNGGNLVPNRSVAQVASYISIVTSLGSILLSLLLIRQNRSKKNNAAEAVSLSSFAGDI